MVSAAEDTSGKVYRRGIGVRLEGVTGRDATIHKRQREIALAPLFVSQGSQRRSCCAIVEPQCVTTAHLLRLKTGIPLMLRRQDPSLEKC